MGKKTLQTCITLSVCVLLASFTQTSGQTIQAETSQAGWITTGLGPYTSQTWNDNTAGGATGRYPTTTSFRMMYIPIASTGVSAGFYNINVRWYDSNSETTSIIYLQVGSRTCYGTSTTVCHTGTFAVDDQWAVDAGAGLFGTQSYSGVNVAAGDTIFYYFKQNGGSPRGWIDYVEFVPAFPNTNPPVINNQSFNIDENSLNGTVVGTVVASDPDAGQSVVTYSITAGNTGGVFAIDNSGVLTVNGALDYETTSSYPLTVEACDNGTPVYCSSATITVNINDVYEAPNDFDPVITNAGTSRSIAENSNGGTAVGAALTSSDGDGNSVTYSITGGNTGNAFYINSTTGQIYVNGLLDYETLSSYSLTITATDNGVPSRNSSSVVVINVTDVSESSPSLSAWYGTCSGTSVPIVANAVGAVFAGWEISGGGTTDITSPALASTSVTNHLSSVTYLAKAVVPSGANLITNGGFESGTTGCPSCTGFTSSYTYDSSPDGPGDYVITQNAGSSSGYLYSAAAQEGSWYLAADGSSTLNEVIYQTTVSVTSGQAYAFSGWFANGHEDGASNLGEAAHLEFRVSGTYTGDIQLPIDAGGIWYQYTSAYTATTTGSITIQIVNRNTSGTRNDFLIDNLVFQQASLLSQSITVPACPDPLPVNLILFAGDRENHVNILTWETASENNNSYFWIERSLDGQNFERIGKVDGNGNTNEVNRYVFEDPEVSEGVAYYRLIQVDQDATENQSYTILIRNEKQKNMLAIYPNPNSGTFVLIMKSKEMYKLEIIDLEGRTIEIRDSISDNKIELSGFAAGIYIVSVYYPEEVVYQKMIVY